jgi:hypothetical protein
MTLFKFINYVIFIGIELISGYLFLYIKYFKHGPLNISYN